MTQRSWYVYALCDPDTEDPFYIGKGCGNRIDQHETSISNEAKIQTIRAIQARGKQVLKKKLAEFSSEVDAYIYEWGMIAMLAETLTNIRIGHGRIYNAHAAKEKVFKTEEDYKSRYNAVTQKEVLNELGLSFSQLKRLILKYSIAYVPPGWEIVCGSITYRGFTEMIFDRESVRQLGDALKKEGIGNKKQELVSPPFNL